VRERILAFARAGVDVMLVGGQAAERSVVARMIHRESRRVRAEFVSFAADAPTGADVDEALFGVEGRRGRPRRVGAFARADGGTLFVDEVAALSAGAQARLVRFIKDRDLLPVGAKRPVRVNVRVVLGLAEPLVAAVQAAKLRVDLARCLGDRVVDVGSGEATGDAAATAIVESVPANLAAARAEAEVAAIRGALRTCHGNRAAAARLLGISREGIRQKVKLYDIVI
jgi:DNA-binding NtrC family response regulator